jgi:hypothetical protein
MCLPCGATSWRPPEWCNSLGTPTPVRVCRGNAGTLFALVRRQPNSQHKILQKIWCTSPPRVGWICT